MLVFLLLFALTRPQKGEQQLTWKTTDRKAYIGERLVLNCYGPPHLPPSSLINEVLVQRNDSGHMQILSHCIRARDTCVDHEDGIYVIKKDNFSNFDIAFSSVRLLHIGNYSCAYYDNQRLLLGTEYTYVDVSVPPDIITLFMREGVVPINSSLIAVTAGISTVLTCSTISRPEVNISWDYPKWLFPKHYQSQDIINTYLTETRSKITFTMTSRLQGRTIRCSTSSAEGNEFSLNKSIEVKVLDPANDLSVALYHLKREEMKDGDALKIKVNEDHTLICTMLSRTVNETLPHWNIPLSMTEVQESPSTNIYPYHEDFTLYMIRLKFKGTWGLHKTSVECTAKSENNFYRIKLILQVEGYFQRKFFLIASGTMVTVILVVICCLLIYIKKRRFPVSEIHHTYLRKGDKQTTASFRRSLPPVPSTTSKGSKKDHLSMSIYNSYSNIYDAINEAEEKRHLDVIPYRDICFIMELQTSRYTRRWLGSFASGENTKEVLITSVDDTSEPKVQLLWQSYVALILRLPEHRNIISIFGMSYYKDFIYVLQDYLETITLRYHLKTEYLNKLENKTTLTSLLKYTEDIVDGMIFLAQQKCCHPGLSAQKILVNSKKTCKMYDFCATSDATDVLESYNLEEDHDAFSSLPPESLFLGEYTPASDVWSIGVTCWEILSCGEVPFPNVTLNEFEGLLRKRQRLERPEGVPYEIFEIIQSCWSQRTARRPTLATIKQKLEAATSSIYIMVKQEDNLTSIRKNEDEGDVTLERIQTDTDNDHIYQKKLSL